MPEASITGSRGEMPVYVAEPAGTGPWPGVVVISDALGMTSDLRKQVDWLGGEGYLAVAPDLYYWGGRLRCMFAAMRQAMAREGDYFADFDAVHRWLSARADCSGRIGVIGFCMGGGFALLLSALGEYDVSSVNYGSVPKDAMTFLADACPIVGSYGGRDPTLKTAPALLEQALTTNEIPHDIMVYPEAGHAFMNNPDPAEVPTWAVLAGRFSTSGFHGPSDADARRRILRFFASHLQGSA
jgi:carboxymethylenebutenolidase